MSCGVPTIRCRQIEKSDLEGVGLLLGAGFGDPHRNFWGWISRVTRSRLPAARFSCHRNAERRPRPVNQRAVQFWTMALTRLATHKTPAGCPKFGYLLEVDNKPVGALLLIFAAIVVGGVETLRCNVSSWYVDPLFRAYATLLSSRAMRLKRVTYYNVTPSSMTWTILAVQGYERYCEGAFISIPAFNGRLNGCRVTEVSADTAHGDDLRESEVALLITH